MQAESMKKENNDSNYTIGKERAGRFGRLKVKKCMTLQ